MSTRPRAAWTTASAVALLLILVVPVAAREAVDPTSLNPPPPSQFNPVCETIGRGVLCTIEFSDPVVANEPAGIVCGSVELHISLTRSIVGKRFYDADGNLTQRHFRESYTGTFSNPETGNVAEWVQHDTIINNLGIPGDPSTGTTQISGQFVRVWIDGGGTILTGAGTFLFNEATGELLRDGGKHPIDDYFTGVGPDALEPLCEALD